MILSIFCFDLCEWTLHLFLFLSITLGATFKMLKAVLKKSREGGKGTKKDPGMNINAMFYTPDELCTANPGLSILWCSDAHPWGSSLPTSPSCCLCSRSCRCQPAWEADPVHLFLHHHRAGRVRAVVLGCCPRNTESRLCVLCCQLLHGLGPGLPNPQLQKCSLNCLFITI